MFAGTYARGIWKSEDGGENWEESTEGYFELPDSSLRKTLGDYYQVNRIKYYNGSSDTIFAICGESGIGIARTIDGGESWDEINSGFESDFNVNDMLTDPDSTSLVYAALSGPDGGLYRSFNLGNNWEQIEIYIDNREITEFVSIAQDPDNSEHIFMIGDNLLFESTDGGENWDFHLADEELEFWFHDNVVIDPSNNQNMWAIGYNIDMHSQLIFSFNGGDTWDEDQQYNLTSIYIDHESNLYIYKFGYPQWVRSLKKSDNLGETWTTIGEDLPMIIPWEWTNEDYIGWIGFFESNPVNPRSLWLGSRFGFWHSQDGGENFINSGSGIDNSSISQFVVSPHDPEIIHGYTDTEHWVSQNGGNDWVSLGIEPIRELQYNPTNSSVVFRGGERLLRSTNDGESWDDIRGEIQGVIYSIAILPEHSDTIFCTSFNYSNFTHNFYKSFNGGDTWSEIPIDLPNHNGILHVFNITDYHNFLGLLTDNTIYKSENLGITWTYITEFGDHDSVFLKPGGQGLFVLTSDSILFSYDGGETFDRYNRNTINHRIHWAEIKPDTDSLFISTYFGIFKTGDGGESWNYINGMYSQFTECLAFTSDGERIHVGTSGRGIWTYNYEMDVANKKFMEDNAPSQYTLCNIYPNPFNSYLILNFRLFEQIPLRMSITDQLGRIVSNKRLDNLRIGSNRIFINVFNNNLKYSSGIYYLNIISHEKSNTKKIIFIK
ncbi:MAG: T9SS type A sorting domain-containing protein [Candidatus Electryonea clarkiae]|nr:T9SS type A sorting domain-containing protein [Candidatus Electryonea clarkiae]